MSIYRITDVTPVGAYMNAMKARHDGDRREASKNKNIYKAPSIRSCLGRMIRNFLASPANQMPRKQTKSAPAE